MSYQPNLCLRYEQNGFHRTFKRAYLDCQQRWGDPSTPPEAEGLSTKKNILKIKQKISPMIFLSGTIMGLATNNLFYKKKVFFFIVPNPVTTNFCFWGFIYIFWINFYSVLRIWRLFQILTKYFPYWIRLDRSPCNMENWKCT